jgi:hypothetical protein
MASQTVAGRTSSSSQRTKGSRICRDFRNESSSVPEVLLICMPMLRAISERSGAPACSALIQVKIKSYLAALESLDHAFLHARLQEILEIRFLRLEPNGQKQGCALLRRWMVQEVALTAPCQCPFLVTTNSRYTLARTKHRPARPRPKSRSIAVGVIPHDRRARSR